MGSFNDWFMGYNLDRPYPPCNRPGGQVAEGVIADQTAVSSSTPDGVVPFVLSLLGLLGPLVLSPLAFIALYLANRDRKVCEAQGIAVPRLVTAAWVISIVAIFLLVVAIVALLMIFLVLA